MRWEINGSKGTLVFDSERQNELLVNMGNTTPGEHAQGFRTVLVSEAYHPYWEHWWPHGHMIGWEDNFVHELLHLLTCIKDEAPVGPRGATMEDGYRCAEVCDAIVRSHETGERQEIAYRGLNG
jgi:predicted dehydrogenase